MAQPQQSTLNHTGSSSKKVDDVTQIILEVLDDHLNEKTPNPYRQRWWTMKLTLLKKSQNHLSRKSVRLQHVRNHPVHAEYKSAANKFKEVMHKNLRPRLEGLVGVSIAAGFVCC